MPDTTNQVVTSDSKTTSGEINNLINNHLELIEKTKGEIQVLKDQIEEALSGDANYQDAQKEMEIVKETKATARQKAESNPTIEAIASELKEKKGALKDYKDAVSAELFEYYKATGSSEITTSDGRTYTFSFSVKLT